MQVKPMDLGRASRQLLVIVSSAFLHKSPSRLPFYQELLHERTTFNKNEKSRIVYDKQ